MSLSSGLISFLNALDFVYWTSILFYLIFPVGSLASFLLLKNIYSRALAVFGISISLWFFFAINGQELKFLLGVVFDSGSRNSKVYYFEQRGPSPSIENDPVMRGIERLPVDGIQVEQTYLCAKVGLADLHFAESRNLLSFAGDSLLESADPHSLLFLERIFRNRLNESKTSLELSKKHSRRTLRGLKLINQRTMIGVLKTFNREIIWTRWSEEDFPVEVFSNLDASRFSKVTEDCRRGIQERPSEIKVLSSTNILPLLNFREGLHFGSSTNEFKGSEWDEYANRIFWVMGVKDNLRVAVIPSWEGPLVFICDELEDPLCLRNLHSSMKNEDAAKFNFVEEVLRVFFADERAELFKASCSDLDSLKNSDVDSSLLLSHSLSCLYRDLDFSFGGVGLARLMQRGSPKFFEYLAEQSFLGLCFSAPQTVPTLSEVRDKLISDFVFPYRTRHARSCLRRLESRENSFLFEDVFRSTTQESSFFYRNMNREIGLRNQWRSLVMHSIENRQFERLLNQKVVHDQLYEKVQPRLSFGRFDKYLHHLYTKARDGRIGESDFDEVDRFFQRERALGSDFMLLTYYKILVSLNKYFDPSQFHKQLFERTLDQSYCRFHCLQIIDDYIRNTLKRPVSNWENFKERDLSATERLNNRKNYLRSVILKAD